MKFRVPQQQLPHASHRGKIVKHGDCGRYISMKGGFNYDTGKPGREYFLHATKGWRTRRGSA